MEDVIEEYKSSLGDLTFNSKPHINNLTILADENKQYADRVVQLIEVQLSKAHAKLPVMYLLDSIVKNVGENYKPLFAKNIVSTFRTAFISSDDESKMRLYKLRSTWDNYFPLKRLFALDNTIHGLDPNWPVKPLPAHLQDHGATNIHVNPKFLKKGSETATIQKPETTNPLKKDGSNAAVTDVDKIKQQLVQQQKELLELQQKKLMLELEQTKQQLEAKQKEISHTAKKQVPPTKDPRLKPSSIKVGPGQLQITISHDQAAVKAATNQKNLGPKDPRLQRNDAIKASTKSSSSSAKSVPSSETKSAPSLPLAKKAKSIDAQKVKEGTAKGKNISQVTASPPFKSKGNKKKQAANQEEHDEMFDHDKRKKRPFKNKSRSSPTPPPKVARNMTSTTLPPAAASETAAKRSHRSAQDKQATRSQILKDEHFRLSDSPRSSESSASPRFSPEPDTDDTSQSTDWTPPVKRSRLAGGVQRLRSIDPDVEIPKELTLGHQNEILRQADVQFRNGQLTHEQYQELLKQLHQLFELQRNRKIQESKGIPAADPRISRNRDENSPFASAHRRPHRPESSKPFHDELRPPLQTNEPNSRPLERPEKLHSRPSHRRPFRQDGQLKLPPNRETVIPQAPHKGLPRPSVTVGSKDPRRPLPRNSTVPKLDDSRVQNDPRLRRRSCSPPHHVVDLSPPDFMRERFPKESANTRQTNLRKYALGDRKDLAGSASVPPPGAKPAPPVVSSAAGFKHPDSAALGKVNLEEPEDYIIASMPPGEVEETPTFEEPEDYIIANIKEKSTKTPCEEPEDYIIANMPSDSEAYHKHAEKLKIDGDSEKIYRGHLKKIKTSMYTKELNAARQSSNKKSDSSEAPDSGTAASGNDCVVIADTKPDDGLKSPPLPLKKRKYMNKAKEMPEDKQQSAEQKTDAEASAGNTKSNENKAPKPSALQHGGSAAADAKSSSKPDSKKSKTFSESEKRLKKANREQTIRKPVNRTSPKRHDPNSDPDSLIYVIDEEEHGGPVPPHSPPRFRPGAERAVRRGRMRPLQRGGRMRRELAEEEARIRRMLEDERKTLEWEESLQRQLEMEERRSKERLGRPFDRRGRGRGPPPHDRWGSPERAFGEFGPPPDIARGRIPGRPLPPHPDRHGPEPHFPPPLERGRMRREMRMQPMFRGLSPPPPLPPPPDMMDRRRPRSPPDRRLPPRHEMHPFDIRDERWDVPRRPPPGGDLRDIRDPPPYIRNEERLPPPEMRSKDALPQDPSLPPALTPKQAQPVMKQVNVDKLLSELVTMGILPEVKKEPKKAEPPAASSPESSQSPQQPASVLPSSPSQPVVSDVKEDKPEPQRSVSPLDDDLLNLDPDANVPDIFLTSDLKIRHDEVIKRLYTGIQCSACGLRFTTRQTDLYAEHLDWHYRLNRKDKEGGAQAHREIYPTAGDWICHEEIEDPQERNKNVFFDAEEVDREEAVLNVPLTGKAGEDTCKVCKEAFETFYNETEDEWQFASCVKVDDDNFHPSCYEDYYDGQTGQTPVKSEPVSSFKSILDEDGIPGLEMIKRETVDDDEMETEPEKESAAEEKEEPTSEEVEAKSEKCDQSEEIDVLIETEVEPTKTDATLSGSADDAPEPTKEPSNEDAMDTSECDALATKTMEETSDGDAVATKTMEETSDGGAVATKTTVECDVKRSESSDLAETTTSKDEGSAPMVSVGEEPESENHSEATVHSAVESAQCIDSESKSSNSLPPNNADACASSAETLIASEETASVQPEAESDKASTPPFADNNDVVSESS